MTEAERKEEELIKAGGIHPYPWEIHKFKNNYIKIVDNSGQIIIEGIKPSVAKAIVESYNRRPIIILEDDVVY